MLMVSEQAPSPRGSFIDPNDMIARTGGVIRADVHVGQDGRPKGSGIVVFETPDDARNAIQQFNGYDWQGRLLEVREDRFAGAGMAGGYGRGGFGGGRGGFGGGFGRGGFGGGRGGFGYGGRGGFGGGGGGFDANAAPGAQSAPPNPFTDHATAGTDKNEIIYVRNVSRNLGLSPVAGTNPKLISISISCPGLRATTILSNSFRRSVRSSRQRFSTKRAADLAAVASCDSTVPTQLRLQLPNSRATSTEADLLDSTSSSTPRLVQETPWIPIPTEVSPRIRSCEGSPVLTGSGLYLGQWSWLAQVYPPAILVFDTRQILRSGLLLVKYLEATELNGRGSGIFEHRHPMTLFSLDLFRRLPLSPIS